MRTNIYLHILPSLTQCVVEQWRRYCRQELPICALDCLFLLQSWRCRLLDKILIKKLKKISRGSRISELAIPCSNCLLQKSNILQVILSWIPALRVATHEGRGSRLEKVLSRTKIFLSGGKVSHIPCPGPFTSKLCYVNIIITSFLHVIFVGCSRLNVCMRC